MWCRESRAAAVVVHRPNPPATSMHRGDCPGETTERFPVHGPSFYGFLTPSGPRPDGTKRSCQFPVGLLSLPDRAQGEQDGAAGDHRHGGGEAAGPSGLSRAPLGRWAAGDLRSSLRECSPGHTGDHRSSRFGVPTQSRRPRCLYPNGVLAPGVLRRSQSMYGARQPATGVRASSRPTS